MTEAPRLNLLYSLKFLSWAVERSVLTQYNVRWSLVIIWNVGIDLLNEALYGLYLGTHVFKRHRPHSFFEHGVCSCTYCVFGCTVIMHHSCCKVFSTPSGSCFFQFKNYLNRSGDRDPPQKNHTSNNSKLYITIFYY